MTHTASEKAIYKHCVEVYDAMLKESHTEPEGTIYEGFLTKLFSRLGLGVPHYSLVRTELVRMGCISQIKRGGGSAPSIWALLTPPTSDAFENLPELTRNALGGRKVQARFEQQIRDLTERVNKIEGAMGL